VTVAAGYSKRRREDTLPLREPTATLLRSYVATKLPAASLFTMPPRWDVADMLRQDMEAARNAWLAEVKGDPKLAEQRERSDFLKPTDAAGQVADFHALRHTFISNLARGGVHPKLAQDLARHSDINLTLGRYSHTVLGEQGDALAALPDLTGPTRQEQRATGTDGQNAVEIVLADCLAELPSKPRLTVHSSSVNGARMASDEKRDNPREVQTKRGESRGEKRKPAVGVEPTTPALRMRCSAN